MLDSGPEGVPSRTDVLIIGSGPTGSAYARILSEEAPDASILMVEAGPWLGTAPGEHVKNVKDPQLHDRAVALSEGRRPGAVDEPRASLFGTGTDRVVPVPGTSFVHPDAAQENQPHSMQAAAMSTNVGGMGAHWGGAAPAPRRDERIAGIPDTEWADVLAVGQRLLAVNTTPRTDAPEWRECLARISAEFDPRLPEDGKVQNMPTAWTRNPDGTDRWSGSDTILGPLARGEHDRFSIVADTVCTRLVTDGRRVTGARMTDRRSGTEWTVLADVVVVAGDSFRTPQLLWASGIRPTALGRHLNEHLMVGAVATPDYLDQPEDTSELFSDSKTLLDMLGDGRSPSDGSGWIPYSGDEQPLHGQFAQSVYHEAGHVRGTGSVVFGFFFAKEGRARDRMVFDDDATDALGLPAFTFEYSLSARDEALRLLAHDGIRRVLSALGDPDAVVEEQPSGMSLHYMGTVRMGASDDGTSVCDTQARVWGYDNLFLGGNGVISSPLACNPTLTSVSLAVRGARAASRELLRMRSMV